MNDSPALWWVLGLLLLLLVLALAVRALRARSRADVPAGRERPADPAGSGARPLATAASRPAGPEAVTPSGPAIEQAPAARTGPAVRRRFEPAPELFEEAPVPEDGPAPDAGHRGSTDADEADGRRRARTPAPTPSSRGPWHDQDRSVGDDLLSGPVPPVELVSDLAEPESRDLPAGRDAWARPAGEGSAGSSAGPRAEAGRRTAATRAVATDAPGVPDRPTPSAGPAEQTGARPGTGTADTVGTDDTGRRGSQHSGAGWFTGETASPTADTPARSSSPAPVPGVASPGGARRLGEIADPPAPGAPAPGEPEPAGAAGSPPADHVAPDPSSGHAERTTPSSGPRPAARRWVDPASGAGPAAGPGTGDRAAATAAGTPTGAAAPGTSDRVEQLRARLQQGSGGEAGKVGALERADRLRERVQNEATERLHTPGQDGQTPAEKLGRLSGRLRDEVRRLRNQGGRGPDGPGR